MRVALFITCLNDTLLPATGQRDRRRVLERLGHEVGLPARADLLRADARQRRLPATRRCRWCARFVARSATSASTRSSRPSGSCVAMVREQYPRLARATGDAGARGAPSRALAPARVRAVAVPRRASSASRTSARASRTASPTTRPATRCALLRVGDAPLRLLRARARASSWSSCRRRRPAAASAARSRSRTPTPRRRCSPTSCAACATRGAEVCTALDSSCLMHIGGGLSRAARPACARCTSPRSWRAPRRGVSGVEAASRTRRASALARRAAAPQPAHGDDDDPRQARRGRRRGRRLGGAARGRARAIKDARDAPPRRRTCEQLERVGAARPAARSTGRATPPRRTRSSRGSCSAAGAREVVKVKSMATDEIGLNDGAGGGRHRRASRPTSPS